MELMYCSKYLQGGRKRKGNTGPLQRCNSVWRHPEGPELAVGEGHKLNLASTFCNTVLCRHWLYPLKAFPLSPYVK